MKITYCLAVFCCLCSFVTNAQRSSAFHTLNMPSASPEVTKTQKLGVTLITVNYHSPELREREVWNDPQVIPQKGNPIPWRAGANMNTTISFSTDVMLNGKALLAGTYGLHIIPNDNDFELLFAHENNQWGSYYLDKEKDVTLALNVNGVKCENSEYLEFRFLERKEDSVVLGLEWGEKRIPFTISVDLNNTVIESLKGELRGINTYRWEAWNDAALWCLNHDTNLPLALEWIDRSINGGYTNFGANENFTNVSTRLRILKKLDRNDEFEKTLSKLVQLDCSAGQVYDFSKYLLESHQFEFAVDFLGPKMKLFPKSWFVQLNGGVANYFNGDVKKALKIVNKAIELCPEAYREALKDIHLQMSNGTYGNQQ